MSTIHDRRLTPGWFRRRARQPVVLAVGLLSAAGLLTGSAAVLTAAPAAADTTAQSFTTPGTYTVTVPDYLTSITLNGLGGAGFPGDPSSSGSSSGGAAGSGTEVSATIGASAAVSSGDTLEIVVGAKGGGGQRGYGDELSGDGGNGGGATYIYDETSGTYLLVAGGGGGGGGGSGLFVGYNGGYGGTEAPGYPGIGVLGGGAGRGGEEITGGDCGGGAVISAGQAGESAPTASAVAGGGGGGSGACGGQSGGSGNHGVGEGGGGGGGSGGSITAPSATNVSIEPGTNSGDGSASVSLTTLPLQAPVVTSANCMYSAASSGGGNEFGVVTATGLPPATLQLLNQPNWLSLGVTVAGNEYVTAYGIYATGQVVPGEYTFQVEATNSQGSIIEPLTMVVEPGIDQPTFLSAATATATVGSPFTFQASEVGCPPIGGYSISQADPDTSNWLSINPSSGLMSGTPTAAAVGTHTFTINADPRGSGTPVTQTFTLQVNPAPASAPGIGTATAGNAQATVSFTPPADDGGSPITSYTVTATDQTTPANGGQTATGTGSPITVTGLTNGDTYTFTVTATNAAGTSPASGPSNAVTPLTAPGVPTFDAVTPGNAQATVSFTPPADDGGSPITSYTVTATDQTTPANGGQTATGTGSPITVTGLTNGDTYTFTVTATNAAGSGAPSPSTSSSTATPLPPGKPSADLSVAISPHPSAADDSTFTETVTVTNHGPWPATDVITAVTVPAKLTVTADPGGSKTGRVVSWHAARIGVNGSVTYTITFKVSSHARGTVLIAAATASLQVPDPRLLNNAALTAVKLG